jgi:translation initiation factor RLI1
MLKLNLNDPQFLPHSGCDVELFLNEKEALTIIGENGLGKSTLVHRFYLLYEDRMSIIEQTPMDQFYNRSLKAVKSFFMEAGKDKMDSAFFLQCWTSFGLDKKENRMLDSLSGGEGQALKICLGLSIKAQVYVLDEPSQYLDESMKKVLSDLIEKKLAMGNSILMVEHDLTWQKFSMKIVELKMVQSTLIKGKEWTT